MDGDEALYSFLDQLSTPSLDSRINSYQQQLQAPPPQAPAERGRKRRRDDTSSSSQQSMNISSSSPTPNTSTDALPWSCRACTLSNDASAASCDACGLARDCGWICGACGTINNHATSGEPCGQCRAPFNAVATQVSTTVPRRSSSGNSSSSNNSSTALLRERTLSLVTSRGEVDDGGTAAAAVEVRGDNTVVEVDDEQEGESEGEYDEEEDDDETSSSDDDEEDADNGALSEEERAAREKKLLAFLGGLTTVPFEALPEAPTPPSMAAKSALHPFQRQGLHWLLSREGHHGSSNSSTNPQGPTTPTTTTTTQSEGPRGLATTPSGGVVVPSSSRPLLPPPPPPSASSSSLGMRMNSILSEAARAATVRPSPTTTLGPSLLAPPPRPLHLSPFDHNPFVRTTAATGSPLAPSFVGHGGAGGNPYAASPQPFVVASGSRSHAGGWQPAPTAAPPPPPPTVSCPGGILADFMGLGKTKMLMALCEATRLPRTLPHQSRLQYARLRSVATLIVCPVSIMGQWTGELTNSIVPPPRVLRYHGSGRNRSLFDIAHQYDYVLTTYQTLAKEPPDGADPPSKMRMISWRRVILDESHFIRNKETQCAKACCSILDGTYRWAVTATPIHNRIDDLFPLLNFLKVPLFEEFPWWRDEIGNVLLGNPEDQKALGLLQVLFSSLMLRRLPSSLVNGRPIVDLTPKTVTNRSVPFSAEEKDFYDAVYRNAAVKLDVVVRRGTALGAYSTAFEMLIPCRQCCLHPYLVVAAMVRKAKNQGMPLSELLAAANTGAEPAGQDDMQQFVASLKRKLRVQSEFAASVLADVTDLSLSSKECMVCLDTITKPAVLPCAHAFCFDCIVNALKCTHNKCPLCKQSARPSEITVIPENLRSTPAQGPALDAIDVQNYRTWYDSSKVKAILAIIQQEAAPDEKIVVFSYFVSFLEYLGAVLDREKITYTKLTGSMSMKARERALSTFHSKPAPRVLLASIAACGVGVNMTRASRCIIADMGWNPAVEEQAMNRVHRIGQTRPVFIDRLVVPETVDQDIQTMQDMKRALTELCIGGFGSSGGGAGSRVSRRLGREELFSLFRRPVQNVPASGEGS